MSKRKGSRSARYVDISKTYFVWEWSEYGKYYPWGTEQSKKLEEAYQKFLKSSSPRHITLKAKNGEEYKVDFQKMTQENQRSYYTRRLRRTENKEPTKKVNVTKLDAMWEKYYDDEEEGMSGEKIMEFCEDLGIDPGDVNLLILFWKVGADQKYFLSKEQFIMGLAKLGMQDETRIKSGLKRMPQEISNDKSFREFYLWLFDYFKDVGAGVRTISSETACQTWQLVFSKKWKFTKDWCDYISEVNKHAVSRDTWKMFLDFTKDGQFKNLSDFKNYNIDESIYPSAVDEFIEFMQQKE